MKKEEEKRKNEVLRVAKKFCLLLFSLSVTPFSAPSFNPTDFHIPFFFFFFSFWSPEIK